MNLTEQWKNGTLELYKQYFCKDLDSGVTDVYKIDIESNDEETWLTLSNGTYRLNNIFHKDNIIILDECSYSQQKQLKQQLAKYEEALKSLKEEISCENFIKKGHHSCIVNSNNIIDQALEQKERG